MNSISRNGSSYEFFGPANAEVIVFIHGLGLNRLIWSDYLTQFSSRYRVLSYDLFAHGESCAPPEKPDLSTYSNQLLELLDELDIQRAALIGFSLGGMINRRFSIDHAERVSALVILNSPHERSSRAQKLAEQQALDSTAGGPAATLDAAIERWFSEAFRQTQNGYIQQVRDWVLANDAMQYAHCRQVLASGVIELIKPLPPIQKPTLIMTCENDSGSTPAMSHAIAREIEAADVIILPHLKHMGLVEQPALFIEPVLAFLTQTLTRFE